MPVCLNKDSGNAWLRGRDRMDLSFPNYDPDLIAEEIEPGIVDLFSPAKNSD